MHNREIEIEILAPAGTYESMRAAMNAGCDAVYIGGSSFGARAYAGNPDQETLLRAIDEAHIRGKKLYLTVNTLVKEGEMEELFDFLNPFYREGLDAAIVQDVGVMHFIHNNFPGLDLHASTQTTLMSAQGANLFKKNGITRIVTAREQSFEEIRAIRENTDLEIETFVHGALCYCYSGQCLMSSLIGGRSGNRGRCAQPCRMPYHFQRDGETLPGGKMRGEGKYLLSPKDINTLSLIPDLIEAGVDSLKIEGRMKRPEYAAGVAGLYRKAVDIYQESGREGYDKYLQSGTFKEDMGNLMDLYNRGGFSEGYGKSYHGKHMMSIDRPNHSGVLVGEVKEFKNTQAMIRLTGNINAQDILEIRDPQGVSGYEFTVKSPLVQGNVFAANMGKNPFEDGKIEADKKYLVYRTKNNQLLNRLREDYLEKDRKKEIRGTLSDKEGQPLTLSLFDGETEVTVSGDPVQQAQKQPMTEERLKAPIMKLGDTLYFMETLEVDMDEAVFAPVAWLNELRREAVERLQQAVIDKDRRAGADWKKARETDGDQRIQLTVQNIDDNTQKTNKNIEDIEINITVDSSLSVRKTPGLAASVRRREQFDALEQEDGITAIYGDYEGFSMDELKDMAVRCSEKGIGFYILLPQICRLSLYENLKRDIVLLSGENDIKGFILRNFEQAAMFREIREKGNFEKELILNHNMYVFNRESKRFWREEGIGRYTAPLELNSRELEEIGIQDCDLMVYGMLPMMISAQCLYETTGGCRKCRPGEDRQDYLIDRMGMNLYVQTNCKGCYNVIYNAKRLSLLRYPAEIHSLNPSNLRMDFINESAQETEQVAKAFRKVFFEQGRCELPMEELTAGHFKRGVS